MNGIEKITARITAEATEAAAAVIAEAEKTAGEIRAAYQKKADEAYEARMNEGNTEVRLGAEREQRASDIMDLVGLSSCADLYPNQVSASMMQRIAVSRAFAVNPDLLLMDEPYGQLDVKLRFYLEDELVNLWQKLNSTILFVTHNIEEAVYVAERILVLTNKPTKVKAEIQVDLPRPRKLIDPRFVELRRQVTELIRWW